MGSSGFIVQSVAKSSGVVRVAHAIDKIERTKRSAGRLGDALLASPAALVGCVVLVLLVLVSVFAPFVAPHDPLAQIARPFEPISANHLLGTDELGRDLLSRLIYALRLTLLVAVLTSVLAGVVGIATGLVAGFFEGWFDAALMRLLDVVLSVPAILLAIVLIAVMGGGLLPLIVAIAVVAMPAFARLTRASVLSLKTRDFVTAQKAAGASNASILFRTILPNAIGPAMVQLIVTASISILTESGLSFLGLGASPPEPSLGGMLAAGNENLFISPFYPVIVGFAIAILVAAFDAFGSGLQRAYGYSSAGGRTLA